MAVVVPAPDSSPSEPGPGGRWQSGVRAAHAGAGRDLTIWTDQSYNRCVLWLRGRLCWDTVAVLDRHVDRLGCFWCDEVVVDIGAVEQMEPVGARLLVGFGHYVAGRGGRFEVRGASPQVEALIATARAELGA